MRVLVVDDDDSLRAMICELLIEIGYELVGFATLDEVVDNSSFPIKRGDLILIDINGDRATEMRAALASAFPHAIVASVGDGDYEAIPRARERDRKRRARVSQHRAHTERLVVAR